MHSRLVQEITDRNEGKFEHFVLEESSGAKGRLLKHQNIQKFLGRWEHHVVVGELHTVGRALSEMECSWYLL